MARRQRDPVCVWSNVPGEASEVPATPMDAGMLRPYISALVIQYTGTMLDKALDVLRTQIEKSVNRHRGTVAIVATDLEGALINRRSGARDSRPGPLTADQIVGFVYSQTVVPAWLKPDSPFVDTRHYSVVMVRRGPLIAINAERSVLRRHYQMDTRGSLSTIPPNTETIHKWGTSPRETRSLSLHGTHRRQRRKADSKNIHGADLRSALNPFEDSTFTFSSARAEVDEDTHTGFREWSERRRPEATSGTGRARALATSD